MHSSPLFTAMVDVDHQKIGGDKRIYLSLVVVAVLLHSYVNTSLAEELPTVYSKAWPEPTNGAIV